MTTQTKKPAKRKPQLGQKPARRPGQPSLYTTALGKKVCEEIMLGATLRQIGATPGMPTKTTIIRWLADSQKHAEFCDQYARAREVQAEVMADEIMDIAEDSRNDWVERENARTGGTFVALNEEALARARTRIETRKWLMGKRKPKKFGDSTSLRLGGAGKTGEEGGEDETIGFVLLPAKRSSDGGSAG